MRGSTLIVLTTALFYSAQIGWFPLSPQNLRALQPKGALSEKLCGGYLSPTEIFYTIILFPLNNFVNYLAGIYFKNICQQREQ